MQLAWAAATSQRTLILTPLCVAEQTVAEGQKFGVPVVYARSEPVQASGVIVTNYERLDQFDPSRYGAVVLDESSILKAFDGKTRTALIQAFSRTPYRLCCTATPSPNDIAELANHCEFLGLMTRSEFLATWFVHDDEGWRMKGHAAKPFYRWLASWAVALRSPADIGFPDDRFSLPPLRFHEVVVETSGPSHALFPELGTSGIHGRLRARRDSLEARVEASVLAARQEESACLIWCGLHAESDAIADVMPEAVNVKGADTYAEKAAAVRGFVSGTILTLVSKVRILGFGLNFQHCHRMVFCGIGDSFEQYYQAIRRCWRFGQSSPVDVSIVVSEAERIVLDNVRRKEASATGLSAALLAQMHDFQREELS
jgi:superfamily II DNA or RNA helicase